MHATHRFYNQFRAPARCWRRMYGCIYNEAKRRRLCLCLAFALREGFLSGSLKKKIGPPGKKRKSALEAIWGIVGWDGMLGCGGQVFDPVYDSASE